MARLIQRHVADGLVRTLSVLIKQHLPPHRTQQLGDDLLCMSLSLLTVLLRHGLYEWLFRITQRVGDDFVLACGERQELPQASSIDGINERRTKRMMEEV